jgi:flagellin
MSVNSILTNASALSALQSLNMTEQNLSITQNQVSSGLAVANASQNAAYWSIGQQLNSDSGIVTATNSALSQSQALFDTATSAINSVLTTINSIQTALTEAANPTAGGPTISTLNTQLTSLSAQLTDAIAGASFNGTNILDGSISSGSAMSFVSGFDASATGGTVQTIGFTTQSLTGAKGANTSATVVGPNVTDSPTATSLQKMFNAFATQTATAASYGQDFIATTADSLTVNSVDVNGVSTATTYTGYDTNGNPATGTTAFTDTTAAIIAATATPAIAAVTAVPASAGPPAVAAVVGVTGQTAVAAVPSNAFLGVSVTTTQPNTATAGILTSGGFNMTLLGTGTNAAGATLTGVTSINASAMLTAAGVAFAAVTSYAANIGATQDRMTAAATLNSALTTNYALGVSSLVDADMNVASTRLQALQTQQQLGIQSLSIANQNSQLILKLFNG